jgi:uncharacterized membrane protein (Fun14 family)
MTPTSIQLGEGSLLVFYIGYTLDKTKTLYVMVAF